MPSPKPSSRLGIYGGTFDPPHRGHLAAARACLSHLRLDSVLWIPCGTPALKDTAQASAEDRLDMVRLTIADEPAFAVDTTEIDRAGVSYTWQTLEQLAEQQPESARWLILGLDAVRDFARWRRPERIVELARLAVVDRPGEESDRIHDSLPSWVLAAIDWVPLDPVEAASREIRAAVAAGESVEALVPDRVASFIAQHRLYGSA